MITDGSEELHPRELSKELPLVVEVSTEKPFIFLLGNNAPFCYLSLSCSRAGM